MESGSNKPLDELIRWELPEALKYLSLPRVLKLMLMSKQPPLPLDRLGGPDVLGMFPGSMAEFRLAAGRPVVPLVPDCPDGVVIVGRLLAFYWQAGVLVGSATAIDRWLAMRDDAS